MKIVEFYDKAFLHKNYEIRQPAGVLAEFVDFYWQTRYAETNVENFSVQTFSRLGSTLLFNVGTSFSLLKRGAKFDLKNSSVYYLRDSSILSLHYPGNILFGLQLKINLPLLKVRCSPMNKAGFVKANFFVPKKVETSIRDARSLDERIEVLNPFLINTIEEKNLREAHVVNTAIEKYNSYIDEGMTIDKLSKLLFCAPKTIERYFEKCLSINPKRALNTVRAREALNCYVNNRPGFSIYQYGYYDHSHFWKSIRGLERAG